jgi:hypothetical protein
MSSIKRREFISLLGGRGSGVAARGGARSKAGRCSASVCGGVRRPSGTIVATNVWLEITRPRTGAKRLRSVRPANGGST